MLRNADNRAAAGLEREEYLPLFAMSEEQLSAFLAKLKDDAGLQEKFKGAADLDAAVAIAKEAGYEVSKAEWLKAEAIQSSSSQKMEMSDEELAGVTGGSLGSLEEGYILKQVLWDHSTIN